MTSQNEAQNEAQNEDPIEPQETAQADTFYYQIQFRPNGQMSSASAAIADLKASELVMAQTDHGPEPAVVKGAGFKWPGPQSKRNTPPTKIQRRANAEEIEKSARLIEREQEAFEICQSQIAALKLDMKLIRVERYFNGSKIIFYFTAENRVDFRELVKGLVQEFRTRVEMRQIGVRHETKLIGGLGCCGRELCCSSYINKFAPVSIKMAKEQDVPLNPAKISGICNRLLCCLTYEYDSYRQIKKKMPRAGKTITLNNETLKVLNCNVLQETITVAPPGDRDKSQVLNRSEWEQAKPVQQQQPQKQKKNKK
ncbi:MAG: regulatory iron-sulfur-containing complex subunit RicT [Desulfuromonadales bacterium]|nr:regulatory iron-sulfur-containing complex subunit RicT [Desulfuromonadales bacterium]